MAYPYKTYKRYTPKQDTSDWNATTQGVYKNNAFSDGNYSGIGFIGGFVLIIIVVSLASWIKGRREESKWVKEWQETKEKKELDKRNTSCAGINPFGYDGASKQTTIVKKPDEPEAFVPFTALVRRRNKELFTKEVPTEVEVTVLDSSKAVVSMKTIKGKLQLEALIGTLGLTVPKGFELRIKEKDAKTYV